jgi:ribosomal 50S subunit-recycling heat shock protein
VTADGRLVRAAREVAPGDPVAARTGRGTVHATVTRIED